ncbi:2607_t:CDS:1, partial [Racocetra fulgida]
MSQFVELPLELLNLKPSDETIFIDKVGESVPLTTWKNLCNPPTDGEKPTEDEEEDDWQNYCT